MEFISLCDRLSLCKPLESYLETIGSVMRSSLKARDFWKANAEQQQMEIIELSHKRVVPLTNDSAIFSLVDVLVPSHKDNLQSYRTMVRRKIRAVCMVPEDSLCRDLEQTCGGQRSKLIGGDVTIGINITHQMLWYEQF